MREVMFLYNVDKSVLEKASKETGFIRDNLEKVYRLIDVLEFMNGNAYLNNRLVLKGGTAINLTVFDLPRLSVDIDLDFSQNCSREEMIKARAEIDEIITRYMLASGYTKDTGRGRDAHALNSWVYSYVNTGGNKDNIKIEINYSMRAHVLPIISKEIIFDFMNTPINVKALEKLELFGSKIKALLERTAARDLFDVNNMVNNEIIDLKEKDILRKCVLFYKTAGSTGDVKREINLDTIDKLTFTDLRKTLLPVLRKSEYVDIDKMKNNVKNYLSDLLVFTDKENEYLDLFLKGEYRPDLLFDDSDIVERIINHPMAIWKVQNIR